MPTTTVRSGRLGSVSRLSLGLIGAGQGKFGVRIGVRETIMVDPTQNLNP